MKLRSIITVGLVICFTLGLASMLITGDASGARSSEDVENSSSIDVYLPLSLKSAPWITTFGSQFKSLSDSGVANLAREGGLQWARMDAFHWAQIEPVNTNAAGYDWTAVDEASLITAGENGLKVIGIIRTTPGWAQKITPYSCGAIHKDWLLEFANFVNELVKRYSVEPYNIKYWEIWNEPDVVYSPELGFDSVFGCWGDASQTYYGGVYYGEMLNVIYPAIKSADPNAQVGIGGLLMDCDPSHDNSCHSGKFLQGIIRETDIHERGDNFDFISYHGYTPYTEANGLSLDEKNDQWAHRGGVVLGKLDYIRELLQIYSLKKPVFHTEGALLCPETNPADCSPPGSNFEEAQADYVVWLFVRNWANDVEVTIWYEFMGPGWRYSGLLDGSQIPKPAYNALKFLTQELGRAAYTGRVMENTAVDGYGFSTDDKNVWVLWSPDEVNHTVGIPSSAQKAYDKYGVEIPITANQITVNSPVYIEFSN